MAGLGCLFVMLNPFWLLLFLSNPVVSLLLVILIVFPLLGTKFVSFLRYVNYTFTEFLVDKGDNLISGKERRHASMGEYGESYRRMEREEKRRKQQQWQREQQERQRRQQEEWNERFRQWYHQQQNQGGGWYQQYGGQQYANPTTDFNRKYEESCDILRVPYDADKYQIKLAYRKLAKQYHPDLNSEPGAKEKFQEINNAYEFLSEENIERYKSLHR